MKFFRKLDELNGEKGKTITRERDRLVKILRTNGYPRHKIKSWIFDTELEMLEDWERCGEKFRQIWHE